MRYKKNIFLYNIKPNDIQATQKDLKSPDALLKMKSSNKVRVEEEENKLSLITRIPYKYKSVQLSLVQIVPNINNLQATLAEKKMLAKRYK